MPLSDKKIGGPCPKCGAALMRRERARLFRDGSGDVAYCARCNAAWDIAEDGPRAIEPMGPKPKAV
jgi:hypothetical protein